MDDIVENKNERPAMRPEPTRELSSRELADKRAKEILSQDDFDEDFNDQFAVDPRLIPDGWDFQWKVLTVYGKENPSYQMQLIRMGWEAVPSSMVPGMLPLDDNSKTVIRDGMILMMRPKEITENLRKKQLMTSRDQVTQKEKELDVAPPGQFEREYKGESLNRIRRSVEPIPVPE
jgi:hypothetical protein